MIPLAIPTVLSALASATSNDTSTDTSSSGTTSTTNTTLDDELQAAMMRWAVADFMQSVIFPDPDDPATTPQLDANGSW